MYICNSFILSFLGWLSHHAIQIGKAVAHLPSFYMEQPCSTYDECLRVRNHTNLPFILDENVTDLQSLIRAWQDHCADVVNIKISKFGGITRAKEATELCSHLGIAMTIEDTWGGMNSVDVIFIQIFSFFRKELSISRVSFAI